MWSAYDVVSVSVCPPMLALSGLFLFARGFTTLFPAGPQGRKAGGA